MSKALCRASCVLWALGASFSSPAATIVVNSTADVIANDGQCTLREAILAANTNTASGAAVGECTAGAPGLDLITFAIPGPGVHTIAPGSLLPPITEAVTIDGYTQPANGGAAASPNSNAFPGALNTVLLIEIDGTAAPILSVNGSGSTIRGLVFNRGNDEIRVAADNVKIQGNFIGTNPAGTVALPGGSGGYGVRQASGNGNFYGGAAAAERNLISGNLQGGISIDNGDGAQIVGNFIGTDVTGTVSLSGGGFRVGVVVLGPAFFVTSNTTILGNLVSGNSGGGLTLSSDGGVLVQGNLIGTQRDGVSALGNGQPGVYIPSGSGMRIGGTGAGQGNVIRFNQGTGVVVQSPAINNLISGNSIASNTGLGISLNNAAVGTPLPNDLCDVDTNLGNHGQNYPVITSAAIAAGNVTISGTLNSVAGTDYRIELFSSAACDASGNGEGQTFLGFVNVTTPIGSCDVTFGPVVFPIPPGQTVITATATALPFDTSEFSLCFNAAGPPPTPTPTATVTPTVTATPPTTPTPTPGSGPGASAVPALEPNFMALLGIALAAAALLTIRRSG